ncbi:MAG: putative membrane protein [Cellvibrionaceae bacterium]|jgi:putative membrane protein
MSGNKENKNNDRTLKEYAGLVFKGMAMGASDVVPGVSGGTMAFILGIYQELIDSIRAVGSKELFQALFSFNIAKIFEILNWKFLVAVGAGIGIAILSLAGILEYLLENQPVFLWSFFFGLVIASIISVQKQVNSWGARPVIALVLGAIGAYVLVGSVPAETPNTWWFLILSGMIAICAMILPGISGSFILVLMGKYQTVLGAVTDRDIITLAFVAIGAGIGLVTFAQVLSYFFKNYNDVTVAVLIGLMIGSLRKIWPWKIDINWMRDAAGEFVLSSDGHLRVIEQHNYLPNFGDNGVSEIGGAILLAVIGFGAVLLLERFAGE